MTILFPKEFISRLAPKESAALFPSVGYPKISVVMPTFRQAVFLERSILSVLNQGYPNLELIVIDGGSEDGSVEILKRYDQHITYWVSEADRGQSDALNKGFSMATGDIFAWMNSDDLYFPGAFDHVVAAFAACPEKQLVFGDWAEIDGADTVLCRNFAFDFSLGQFKYEGFHLNSQAMFWRRALHREFGEFDLQLHRTMDYQLILALGIIAGERAFHRVPELLAAFRRHPQQKTTGADARVSNEHRLLSQRYGYADKYRLAGMLKRLLYRGRRAVWYFRRGGVAYVAGKFFYRSAVA